MAILVYNIRNPDFAEGGDVDELFKDVQKALNDPASLRKTTWQSIASTLSKHGGYNDLLTWLDEKYAIRS